MSLMAGFGVMASLSALLLQTPRQAQK